MTCIVALQKNNKVYIGGDSAGSAGGYVAIRNDPKVFKVGNYVFGFTHSFRMGQLLMTSWKPPVRTRSDSSDYKFLCTKFINSVRKCFYQGGFLHKPGDREEGGCFFVGYNGHLYMVDADFQVGIPHHGFDSIGCGRDFALGTMRILIEQDEEEVETVLVKALETATHYSDGVRPPFRIVCGGAKLPKSRLMRAPAVKKKKSRKKKVTRKKKNVK
jgi:ATP-dependent protease HslVU (ClpYQ) peptidase subunit